MAPGERALAVLAGLLLATVPFATALVAIGHAPASEVRIAGQDVSVRPVLGQDTSRLFDGALVRPQDEEVAGKAVGVDVDADWNKLVPTDKSTRRYLISLWEDPEPAIDLIATTARRHLLVWGLGGFLSGVVVVVAVVGLWWQRRRRLADYDPDELRVVTEHNRRLRWAVITGAVGCALVLDVLAARVWWHEDSVVPTATPALDGTPLAGTQVTGLLADVLPFVSVLQPRSTFYDTVSRRLEWALSSQPTVARREDEVVIVAADDFEDVNGMARQVGLAARLVDADLLALTGDLTFAGKPIETYLLDTIDYYSGHRPVHLAPGLHDTPTIIEAAQVREWTVGEGTTSEVGGLSLLVLTDPRVSTVGNFGADDVLRDPDIDVETFLTDAISTACADRPDLIVLHDHRLGRRIAETGCAEVAVIDGRSYEFLGPQPVPGPDGTSTIELTLGSAGGHVDTRPSPGIISRPARFAVVFVDPVRDRARYAMVSVYPDTRVTVTPALPMDRTNPTPVG